MIPLFKVHKPAHVEEKIKTVLDSGYWAEGEYTKQFEETLQKVFNNKYVIATNSCTSALHLAYKILGIEEGSYVLTTPMTCVASNVPLEALKATIVWVDVDPNHGMLSAQTIQETWDRLTDYEKTKVKAVVYVCWGGDLGPLEEVDRICKTLNIKLIIDAAQSFGVKYADNILGDCKHGDMVAMSYQAIKHISTGDGGSLAFRNREDFIRASKLKWFGIDRESFKTPIGEINWFWIYQKWDTNFI